VSLMLLALNSLKLSAQSPPWRRKARPTAASARRSSRVRASPAKTMGGNVPTVRSTSSRSALSGYSGCCCAGRPRQLPTDHWLGGRSAARTARARARARTSAPRPARPHHGKGSAGLGGSAGGDGASAILGWNVYGGQGTFARGCRRWWCPCPLLPLRAGIYTATCDKCQHCTHIILNFYSKKYSVLIIKIIYSISQFSILMFTLYFNLIPIITCSQSSVLSTHAVL
jgi:hypothetical protein